ncbi:MAG: NAD(P)-dependent oxidoreductase [Chitinophagaceae bacterium BSSC1]|nr:MAG: NAD(P)-dependent oxidoreductase [Chitinophagaceae bacterium BSSC1]
MVLCISYTSSKNKQLKLILKCLSLSTNEYFSNMKILVTGSNGFLGQHLTQFLVEKGHQVLALSRGAQRIPVGKFLYQSVDLSQKEAVSQSFEAFKPDLLIHSAAMSKPDECHLDQAACLLHNVTATEHLLAEASKTGARMLYVSTDFIFGENGPHAETAIPNPLNFYGQSKLMAEEIVRASGLDYHIVRPVFIYGKYWEGMRPSFIQWVAQNLEAGKHIKVVSDQLRTPSYVLDLCKGIELVFSGPTNTEYHLAGKDRISPYEMALTVARVKNLDASLITAVTADSFPELVQRAKFSGLKIDKAVQELGYAPVDFETGVRLSFDL